MRSFVFTFAILFNLLFLNACSSPGGMSLPPSQQSFSHLSPHIIDAHTVRIEADQDNEHIALVKRYIKKRFVPSSYTNAGRELNFYIEDMEHYEAGRAGQKELAAELILKVTLHDEFGGFKAQRLSARRSVPVKKSITLAQREHIAAELFEALIFDLDPRLISAINTLAD